MGGGTVGRHALLHHVLDDGTAGGNGIGRGGGDDDEREKRFLSCFDSLLMAPIGDAAGKLTPLESACFRQPSALSSVAIDRACAAGMEIVPRLSVSKAQREAISLSSPFSLFSSLVL